MDTQPMDSAVAGVMEAGGVRARVVKFSGGIGSWAAAKRVAQEHGAAGLTLLFTDTMVERASLYAFLVQGARNVLNPRRSRDLRHVLRLARNLPPLARMEERKRALTRLRKLAMRMVPGLVWIADGRTPWEVFRAERYIGNNRKPICKKILKAELADRWVAERYDLSRTVVHVGIDWSEENRLDRLRVAAPAFTWDAPLCRPPYVDKAQMIAAARRAGLAVSDAYPQGYAHDNCHGGCIQQGQGAWGHTYKHDRPAFDYNMAEEQEWQREVGRTDVGVLRDRRGGTTKALTLVQLAYRIENGGKVDRDEWGGCGCGLADPDDAIQSAA